MNRTEMTMAGELHTGAQGTTSTRGHATISDRAVADRWRPFADLEADLELLSAVGRGRSLERSGGSDFTSNDYLGLAQSIELFEALGDALQRRVPVGAGGSRLLRGNHPEHEALEESAAAYFGSETALYFSTGFAANAAIAATLPRSGDLIVYDSLIHASFRDGLEPAR